MLLTICLALFFFSQGHGSELSNERSEWGVKKLTSTSRVSCLECASNSARRLRIEQIDQKIQELEKKKRGYEGQALRAEDQAIRLQFEDRYIVETRQYNQVAEGLRKKAQEVQKEIDRLEREKAQLLET